MLQTRHSLWVNATDAWTSSEHIHLGDTKKLLIGSDSDLRIWHDGSHGYLDNDTGWLYVGSDNYIFQNKEFNETHARFLHDGAVELYHNNVKTFATDPYGSIIYGPEGYGAHLYMYADEGDDNADKWALLAYASGNFSIRNYSTGSWVDGLTLDGSNNATFAGDINLADNKKFISGDGNDLEVYHNGSNSYMINTTGDLQINSQGDDLLLQAADDIYLMPQGNAAGVTIKGNGAVEAYHNNNKKLETTSSGINVTGAISVNGSPLSAAPEVELTASGSISNNQAVMVQSNGTAKAVAASTAVANPPVANTLNQIWTTDTYQSEICFDSSIDRVVGFFRHQTNGYPWYVVGQPNANGSITWDTPTQLQSTNRTYGKIGSFGNGKVVVVNKPNWGDNETIYVRIGTVNASNNTISWGSEVNVGTGNEPTLEMIDSSYFIVTWRQANASNGMMMKVIQQTGTNGISQGSNQNAGWSDFHMGGNAAEATYNSSTNKCVWAWRSTSNTLRHLIGTVNTSNKTISWGTAGSDPDSGHPNGIDSVWVSDTQFITFFRSNTHSTGRYVVVTISGNNMTSISSPVTFLSSGTAGQPKSEWMSGQSRILLTYKDGSTSDRIRVQIGTFSSGSVTWGTSVLLLGNTGQPEYYGMTPDDEGRAIFLTDDQTNGVSQYSTIVNLTATSTDADKFIGFSTAAYSNGQTATIAVVGNTSTQSSLTAGLKYYVQKNGTLATTADTPSVEAGIALSSTKLLIKG